MASFLAKIGWKRLTKRENKNYCYVSFQPDEAIKEFFNFLNFFAIVFEISITSRVRTKRNDSFCFLSFSAFSIRLWLEMKPLGNFLIFRIILLFFWNFLLRVGQGRNETVLFIFFLSQPFPTYFGLKLSHKGVF